MEILSWWPVSQTAARLGISVMTVHRTIEAGRLHAVRTPLGVLVDPASVEEYARTRRPVRHKGEKIAMLA